MDSRGRGAALLAVPLLILAPAFRVPAPAPAPAGAAGAAAWAESESPEAEHEQAVQELLLPALHELAEWCNGEKLYASRNEVYELIIHYEPDDPVARKGLKYSRNADGEWVLPRENKVKNRNEDAEEEFVDRRSERILPYRNAVVGIMRRHGISPFGEQGQAMLGQVLLADPDEPQVRRILRQMKLGEQWVLEETFLARERRLELDSFAKGALLDAEVGITDDELNETDQALGIAWKHALKAPDVRAVGVVDERELRQILQASQAVGDFFRSVFERDTDYWDGATIYALPDDKDKETFISHYPGLSDAGRDFMRSLASAGIPNTAHVVVWDEDPLRRLDNATRHTMGAYLRKAFGVDANDGWIWEGFGLYFTWRLIGTRLTWYVQSADASERGRTELRGKLMDPEADWRAEAIELLSSRSAPSLDKLLPKTVNDMTAEEMLLAYVLTAYLIEGERAKPAEILLRVGDGGEPSKEVLEEILGMEVPLIQRRLLRWLEEEEPSRDVDPGQTVVAFGQPLAASSKKKRSRRRESAAAVEWVAVDPAAESAMLRTLGKMDDGARTALLDRCVEAARATGAPQVALIDEWTDGWDRDPATLPPKPVYGAHDAIEFKGGSPRKTIEPGHKSWDAFRAWLPPARPAPWTRTVEYDFTTGEIVATPPEKDDEAWELRNLLLGILPGQDLAEARVQSTLDRNGFFRKEAFYFAHLYCDRDARAYAGITLFDVWSNDVGFEVPDPDARAYAILIWGDDTVPVPLSDTEHELWYPRIAESARMLKENTRIARSLAAVWFLSHPELEGGYEATIDTLHAVIAMCDQKADAVAERFERDGDRFVHVALQDVEARGNDAWNAGNARRDALAAGQAQIRSAVVEVLRAEGLL